MARQTLPLRFRILHIIYEAAGKALFTKDIYERLVPEYQGDGQFSLKKMEEHLMAIKAVGLIEGVDPYFDEDHEARFTYRITDAGRGRIRFLPKAWQE